MHDGKLDAGFQSKIFPSKWVEELTGDNWKFESTDVESWFFIQEPNMHWLNIVEVILDICKDIENDWVVISRDQLDVEMDVTNNSTTN